ncbi:MAG: ribosomal-protein-alanine N-acetyltransferase [Desulfobacca sp.]|nr:ribosomal-protein-alanine N-acetyltransferase [Desulfobacca sp.]
MSISSAQLRDLPDLLTIEAASFVHPWSKADFLSELSKSPSTIYVTRSDPAGPVLGYICFWIVADEIQMLNLAVHPAYRRQGLGRALMAFLFNLAREKMALKVFLEVRPSNQTALALYRSLGFEILYRRPRYYDAEGEDALVMEWSLH